VSYPFRRIFNPMDFDENSVAALGVAARIARDNDGSLLLFHVIPMIVAPAGVPVYVDMYKNREEVAAARLREIAAKHLRDVKHELRTHVGEPVGAIIRTAKREAADLIVMAPHGRRGFSRIMLGSVAEMVLREAPCPVLCVPRGDVDQNLVARWMTTDPVAVTPDEKLSTVMERMREGDFRSAPVVEKGRLVGLITDRDVLSRTGRIDEVEVESAMIKDPVTVTPVTPLHEAARILFERKIDSLPVLEDGRLEGVISTSDVLRAFVERD
jgi:nucleotide-binding universal stress UspA family protein